MTYPIIQVSHSSQIEQLGSKEKFWFHNKSEGQKDKTRTLCKIGRVAGENWAEKLTCEMAKILGLPCAEYDLATYYDEEEGIEKNAVVSPSFIHKSTQLIHGNEMLSWTFEEYPKERAFEERQYHLDLVLRFFHETVANQRSIPILLPTGYTPILDAEEQIVDLFSAYLMFDCLIGNQDRHDQNWGYILHTSESGEKRVLRLAPTFDHASSLACRLTDEEKQKRLETKDVGYSIATFVNRGRTPFFLNGTRQSTINCYQFARDSEYTNNKVSELWMDKLSLIDKPALENLLDQFPEDYISEVSAEFTMNFILSNKERILNLKD